MYHVLGDAQGKGQAVCKVRGHTLARFVPKEKEVNEKHYDPAVTWLAKLVDSVSL